VYDMYPWDSDSQGDYPPEPLRSWRDPNPRDTSRDTPGETSPAQAVQTALDRRDNGGDAAGTHAASTHAASTHAAGTRATPPTTSLTRQ
jgi:hypothetical protein